MMQIKAQNIIIYLYGVICSLIIGMLMGGFYLLQGQLIEFVGIGTSFRPVFNAIWIALVGILILVIHQTTGELPKKLGAIKLELHQTRTANYRYVLLQMVLPAIILTSGTSLGPEATLVSSTVLYGLWLQDKLRYLTVNWPNLHGRNRMKALLVPHHYLLKSVDGIRWTPLTVGFFSVGVVSFYITCKLGGEPSVIVYLGQSRWRWTDVIWGIPIVILGLVLGKVYLKIMTGISRGIELRFTRHFSLIVFGGVAIYLASLWMPSINFSGMVNFHLLETSWQHQSPLFLLGHSLLKLTLLTICLNTGWIGGEIFPVLFCATTQGIILGQLLPQVDFVFLVGVFAISMGSVILESPWIAGGVMMVMFLPPNLLAINICLMMGLLILKKIFKR